VPCCGPGGADPECAEPLGEPCAADRPSGLLGVRLQRHGINAHAGRNTARLALSAELPASVLADLTGISIGTAERWSQWAKRDWTSYIGQRVTDVRAEPSVEGWLAGEQQ
jgi:hypothetical protein